MLEKVSVKNAVMTSYNLVESSMNFASLLTRSLINCQELLIETPKPARFIMKMNLQNPMALETITTR